MDYGELKIVASGYSKLETVGCAELETVDIGCIELETVDVSCAEFEIDRRNGYLGFHNIHCEPHILHCFCNMWWQYLEKNVLLVTGSLTALYWMER